MTFIVKHMYDLFIERDVELMEINPLVLTNDFNLFVNHIKIKIDDDSLYRQQELLMHRDLSQMNYQQRIGLLAQLRYVNLEGGNIGLISNSAGYSMAACDTSSPVTRWPRESASARNAPYAQPTSRMSRSSAASDSRIRRRSDARRRRCAKSSR